MALDDDAVEDGEATMDAAASGTQSVTDNVEALGNLPCFDSDGSSSFLTHSAFHRASNRMHKDLIWNDINMDLKDRKGVVQKEILKGVWGSAKVGETTAIMGASGSGKTSLLTILTGRIRSRGKLSIQHKIYLGDVQVAPDKDVRVRNQFAFVSQEDALHEASTPRESLTFSAKLRLPRTTLQEDINNLVENLIQELGLSRCADSVIGGGLKKGISGGEKRRTSIGVELVSHPSTIFLDEPTSGLDSFATRQVMKLLKRVAQEGNTVIFTIHQPSSKVFDSFDRLILLNQGRTMYTGLIDDISNEFEAMGFALPPKYNPADWVVDVAEQNDVLTLEKAGFFPLAPNHTVDSSGSLDIPKYSHVSLWTEFRMLVNRERVSLVRNPLPMIINIVITGILGLIAGVIFFQIGQKERTDLLVLQGQLGALVNVLIATMMGQAQTALTIFSSERPLFLREYATRHYSIGPYFASHLMTEALQSFASVLTQALVVFWMIGFQQRFGQFIAVSFSLSMTSTAVSVWLGAIFSDPKIASGMFTLAIVPQFYFSGVFISIELVPSWVRWAQWLCSLTYASRLSMTYEFGDCTDAEQESCDLFLEQNGVDVSATGFYWLGLVALFCFFRLMGMLTLRYKGLTMQ